MAFFSVIIPTYNRAGLIEKTIKSVLDQAFSDFELIIVDDGSTDSTEAVVSKINDRRMRYFRKTNAERGAARNYGTLRASGQYVTFLDSDDRLYEQHLQTAFVDLASRQKEFYHLRYEITDPTGKRIRLPEKAGEDPNRQLIAGNFMSCQGVFIRKDIAEKNLFDENREMSGLEDWELWLRIAVQYRLHVNDNITSALVDHDERSVVSAASRTIIRKMETFMNAVLTNPAIISYYGNSLRIFKASCLSYISLHVALAKGNRATSLRYLIEALRYNPAGVFKKRFFATLKHLFL